VSTLVRSGFGARERVNPTHARDAALRLRAWLKTQRFSLARHATALRPFRKGEFGTGPESPSEPHRQAANELLESLRGGLITASDQLSAVAKAAETQPSKQKLKEFSAAKERAMGAVQPSWCRR